MADLTPQERLLPFLLDRLTDDEPHSKVESRERRVMSMRQFHRAVLRDLTWLLNASAKAPIEELDLFPEVARSVLNYGMPDIAGTTESMVTPQTVERMVRNAILLFEPRIMRNTLSVRAVESHKPVGNVLAIEIRAQVFAQPLPESLFVKTDVDLETGMCQVQDQLHG
jgi:type VI secretion system protein ImpF